MCLGLGGLVDAGGLQLEPIRRILSGKISREGARRSARIAPSLWIIRECGPYISLGAGRKISVAGVRRGYSHSYVCGHQRAGKGPNLEAPNHEMARTSLASAIEKTEPLRISRQTVREYLVGGRCPRGHIR